MSDEYIVVDISPDLEYTEIDRVADLARQGPVITTVGCQDYQSTS